MKSELKLIKTHLSALGYNPVLLTDKATELQTLSFNLAPGIEAECLTGKPARNLISSTLLIVIDLPESEALITYALATAQIIAPIIIFQTEEQLCLRLLIQSEPKYHLSFINEGIVLLRHTAGAILNPALELSKEPLSKQPTVLPQAISKAIDHLQIREQLL